MNISTVRGVVACAVGVSLLYMGCSKSSPTGPGNSQLGNTGYGYFTITPPNYMDSVLLGSTMYVGWVSDSSLVGTTVIVSLYKGDNFIYSYGTYANSGSDTLLLTLSANYAGSGSDYHWRISSAADPTKYDMGYYFRIYSAYSGTYTVMSPTADSIWSTNASHTIQWTTAGTLGATTTISLYYDTTLITTLTTAAATGSGSYPWSMTANYENSSHYRIRIFNTNDRGLEAYSPYFTIQGGVDPDPYESDGSPASAKSITADGVAQSRTLTFHDTDWVSFTAVSGTTYTIQTSGSLDTYMYLYQTDGVTLITYDDDDGTGLNALITWTCTASGTYYFKVRGYSNRWMGDYSVSVQ